MSVASAAAGSGDGVDRPDDRYLIESITVSNGCYCDVKIWREGQTIGQRWEGWGVRRKISATLRMHHLYTRREEKERQSPIESNQLLGLMIHGWTSREEAKGEEMSADLRFTDVVVMPATS